MIQTIGTSHLESFMKIRKDSLDLYPLNIGGAPLFELDRAKTYADLQQKSEEDFILGYFDHDQLVGIIGCRREKGVKFNHKAFIWGMFVYPEHQGQKIGDKLLTACLIKIANVKGIEKVWLCATHLSLEALSLYRKAGFQQYGREKNAMKWQGESLDMIYMDLPLKQ